MVWGCEVPRWVAHTLQQLGGSWVGVEKEVGGSPEHNKASAVRSMSAIAIFRQSTVGAIQIRRVDCSGCGAVRVWRLPSPGRTGPRHRRRELYLAI